MREETKNGVTFDKSYWPEEGTLISSLPVDLSELWEKYENQASTFVAEALIANPPNLWIEKDGGTLTAACYLWEVGGDTLVKHVPLVDAFDTFIEDDLLDNDAPAVLKMLDELEAAINRARVKLREANGA